MSEKRKKIGDRRDGIKVRDIDGMHAMMANLYKNRTEAEVFIKEEIDVTNLMNFVREKNKENPELKTTPFHLFVQGVGKIIYHKPLLNRFICGRKFYDRNEILMSFMVKRQFAEKAEELILITPIKGETTLNQVSRTIVGDAKALRGGKNNDVDKILKIYSKAPRFLQRFSVMILKWLDFHGWMPESLQEGDPHYSTVLLSNLGSIKCDAPYHHLNNYGTNSIIITIGEIHKSRHIGEDGKVKERDVVNFGITLDERIADGFYFARSIKLLKYILDNPEILEEPIGEEIDYEY